MKRSILILSHGSFWLLIIVSALIFAGILAQNDSIEGAETSYYLGLTLGLVITPGLFSFYTFYVFLFPKYLQKRKIPESIAFGVFLALVSSLVGAVVLYFTVDFVYACYEQSNFLGIAVMTAIGLISGAIALVLKGFLTWFEEIKLKEALLNKNHEMEMALVKSQLDPHFLFNTINNIDVLILKDAEEASNYLNKLSDIMRFMLYETKADEIPLEKEIKYIEKYIELQKIRTANSNYVHFEVTGNAEGKYIAPMVFIPFIENAFKHTHNKKFEHAINIQVKIEESHVSLICKNKFDPTLKKRTGSNGLGNELMTKRLALIYPEKHSLEVKNQNNEYEVELSIIN